MSRRCNIRGLLASPYHREKLMVSIIRATQAVAGIETTVEQATDAYRLALGDVVSDASDGETD